MGRTSRGPLRSITAQLLCILYPILLVICILAMKFSPALPLRLTLQNTQPPYTLLALFLLSTTFPITLLHFNLYIHYTQPLLGRFS